MINIGEVSGISRLDLILEELGIDENDYIWWNGDTKVGVDIPEQLANGPSPILQSKDLHILMTKLNFYIFSTSIKKVEESERHCEVDQNFESVFGAVKIKNV